MTTEPPRRSRPGPPSTQAIRERRFRAVAEPLDVAWLEREPYPKVEVRNPVRRTSYVTLWPEFPGRDGALCTCTDFARRGLGACKHVEAAWRWLRDPPAPPSTPAAPEAAETAGLWEEIDRRLAGLAPAADRDIRDVSAPGRVLFERRPAH